MKTRARCVWASTIIKLFVDVTMGLGQCICRRGFELAIGKIVPCWYYCLCRLLVFCVGSNWPHGAARLEYVLSLLITDRNRYRWYFSISPAGIRFYFRIFVHGVQYGACVSIRGSPVCIPTGSTCPSESYLSHNFTDLELSCLKNFNWCGWFLFTLYKGVLLTT